jgi:hypothetical protein
VATATLEYASDIDGHPAYDVRTEPWGADPFTGPEGRDWDSFHWEGDEATYEWRTGIDRLRTAATQLRNGRRTIVQILKDKHLASWLKLKAEYYLESHEDDDRGCLTINQAVERLLCKIASGSIDPDESEGIYAYYCYESDEFLLDAAKALELPRWAKIRIRGEGGLGSGFDQPCIVLGSGKTLKDLGRWLEERTVP